MVASLARITPSSLAALQRAEVRAAAHVASGAARLLGSGVVRVGPGAGRPGWAVSSASGGSVRIVWSVAGRLLCDCPARIAQNDNDRTAFTCWHCAFVRVHILGGASLLVGPAVAPAPAPAPEPDPEPPTPPAASAARRRRASRAAVPAPIPAPDPARPAAAACPSCSQLHDPREIADLGQCLDCVEYGDYLDYLGGKEAPSMAQPAPTVEPDAEPITPRCVECRRPVPAGIAWGMCPDCNASMTEYARRLSDPRYAQRAQAREARDQRSQRSGRHTFSAASAR